ncbi:MAG: GYF domain-containing protein [Acidobacteriota bacterium]
MSYTVKRGDQEFGPYTLAELQQYVQSGNISVDDMARSEGVDEWVPVSRVVGDIPLAAPVSMAGEIPVPAVPLPGNLPWPVLLVTYLWRVPYLQILSWFVIIWRFVQANWARKLSGKNNALVLVAMDVVGLFSGGVLIGLGAVIHQPLFTMFGGLLMIAGAICGLVAAFSIRDAMEGYYNTVENIGLSMSGVMTFFFNVIYIQYHINRIARWKRTGELS